ncbi:MAG: acyltransferase family protein [Actinobacteria bacterium]|nr:acyltransferase family protein [Actinomycetota bacterium]
MVKLQRNNPNVGRLYYMDSLRALAISLIVLGHCLGGFTPSSPLGIALYNFSSGATALFVFISGFFLHRIYYQRITYTKFVKMKFIDIGIPYLLLSSIFLFFNLLRYGKLPPFPISHQFYDSLSSVNLFILYLLTGATQSAYWYIPFILGIFLLTPLYFRFLGFSQNFKIAMIIALFVTSSIAWRPTANINVVQSVIYFTPFYLSGMYFSEHEARVRKIVMKLLYPLGFTFLSTLALMHFKGVVGNSHKSDLFEFSGIDLVVLKESALILFSLSILYRYFDKSSWFLGRLANLSFPIFFLHGFVLYTISKIGYLSFFYKNVCTRVFLFVVVMIISTSVAQLVRKITGDKSRYLIGK